MRTLKTSVLLSNDKECLTCLKRVATRCSSHVEAFSDEMEALDFIRHNEVDIVIMSMIADKSGAPMCEAIRSVKKHLPIILISSNSGLGDYSLYFKGVDTIEMPIDAEVLMRKAHLYKNLMEAEVTLESITKTRRSTDK